MTTYRVERTDLGHEIIGLAPEHRPDEPNTLLVYRYDGGDIRCTMKTAEQMHAALYDMYQCHDGIKEGDRFETEFGAFVCVSFHVVPETAAPAPVTPPAPVDAMVGLMGTPDPPRLFAPGYRFELRGVAYVVVRASHWTSRRPGYVAGRRRHYLVKDEATGAESHQAESAISKAKPLAIHHHHHQMTTMIDRDKIPDLALLVLLARGPLRPFATSMWYAGTKDASDNERQRSKLCVLVEHGLAEKTRGGWYRITELGRTALPGYQP